MPVTQCENYRATWNTSVCCLNNQLQLYKNCDKQQNLVYKTLQYHWVMCTCSLNSHNSFLYFSLTPTAVYIVSHRMTHILFMVFKNLHVCSYNYGRSHRHTHTIMGTPPPHTIMGTPTPTPSPNTHTHSVPLFLTYVYTHKTYTFMQAHEPCPQT